MILAVKEGLDWLADRKQDDRLRRAATAIENAVIDVLKAGAPLTYDLVGESKAAKCSDVGKAIADLAAAKLH
jgi:isocitrate/isopropylmalate dehydrogenase